MNVSIVTREKAAESALRRRPSPSASTSANRKQLHTQMDPSPAAPSIAFSRCLLRTMQEPEPFAGVATSLNALDSLSLMVYALEYDDPATASLLRDHSPFVPFAKTHLLHSAAAYGCLRAVYTLRKSAKPMSDSAHLEMYADHHGDESTSSDSQRICRLMQWVNSFRPYCFPEGVMYEAAKLGDLQVVRWLHTTTAYSPFLAVEHAAREGHLVIAQWLAEHARGEVVLANGESRYGNVTIEVTVPFDANLGFFAWHASNALRTDPWSDDLYLRTLVRRRGFVYQGKQQGTEFMSLKTGSAYPSEQLHHNDPVVYAAQEGSIELLEVLKHSKDQYNWSFTQAALVQAVKNGQLEALQWLLENEVIAESEYSVAELVTTAMDFDQADILKWLDSKFELEPISFEHVRCAVQGGRLEVVVWVCERFPNLPVEEADLLCLHKGFCHADVMMWLHEHRGAQLDRRMLSAFVKHSDVGLLTAFLERVPGERGSTFTPRDFQDSFEIACEYSSLEMVQYLAETHDAWSQRGFALAARRGNLGVARWIHSMNRPYSPLLTHGVQNLVRQGEWEFLEEVAARGNLYDRFNSFWQIVASDWESSAVDYYPHFVWGHQRKDWEWVTDLARWTLDNYPDKITPANSLGAWACRHGHSDIVRQLIKVEYPSIFTKANLKRILHSTRDGDLVQEFLEHRPELLDYRLFQWTAKHNQLSLLRFLFTAVTKASDRASKSVGYEKSVQLVITTASKYGHLGLLKWMHLNASPAPISPWMSARHGQVHILEWLHESGVMDESKLQAAMQASVQTGQLCVLKWYQSIGREYRFTVDELQGALRRRDVEMIEWILRHQPELRIEGAALRVELESFVKKWSTLAKDLTEAP